MAGGLLGRLLAGVRGDRTRAKTAPAEPKEDPRPDAAQRLEAARDRLKQEIPPPEEDAAPRPQSPPTSPQPPAA